MSELKNVAIMIMHDNLHQFVSLALFFFLSQNDKKICCMIS